MSCFSNFENPEEQRAPRPRDAENTLWPEDAPCSEDTKADEPDDAARAEELVEHDHHESDASKQPNNLISCSLVSSGHPSDCA